MDSKKEDAVNTLVGYSGLSDARAKEFLERANWNVDAAYSLYKSNQMAQSGFQNSAQLNRHSAPVSQERPVVQRPVGVYARPVSHFQQPAFGSVTIGTGPAVSRDSQYPVFQPPQSIPKFPVEGRERIIPIQIEGRQPVKTSGKSTPPPQYDPAWSRQPTANSVIPGMPKSQSYPVHVPVTTSQPKPAQLNRKEDSSLGKGGFSTNDTVSSLNKENRPPSQAVPKASSEKLSTPIQNSSSLVGSASPKILKRGISKISQNASLVDEERKNVLHDIKEDCHDNMYTQTFVLPDITGYSEDFREFLERDLIEMSTLVSLEQAGRLNWWAELGICQRLLPMATTGDGNCLLHAASLAMWGIHDRQLLLRQALYNTLTEKYYRQALYRRWRLQQTQTNKQAGLIFSEEEWKKEWDNVLKLASTAPRVLPGVAQRNSSCCDIANTQASVRSSKEKDEKDEDPMMSSVVYESLEEFHVFVLAHVIQRPIIVVADTILRDAGGEAMAPIPFGGIYLPLECDSSHCYRTPLLLTYDAAHFSALVPMELSNKLDCLPVAIPIVSCEFNILPLHFAIDPGIHFNWDKNTGEFSMPEESKLNLLKRYMDLEKLPINSVFLDSGSDERNSTGSYESDDGLIEKGKKKDSKMQSVSKQFGSFGKSVGKKLKNLGKTSKDEKKAVSRKYSGGQSPRVPLTISALNELDQQAVWCCRIIVKKSDTHQKMIDNYLVDASKRFKLEGTSSPRLNRKDNIGGNEQRNGKVPQERVKCVTSGCNLYGSADTSYLCSQCYADQKKVIIDIREKEHENKHKDRHVVNDVTKVGNSKFYDMTDSKVSYQNHMTEPAQRKSQGYDVTDGERYYPEKNDLRSRANLTVSDVGLKSKSDGLAPKAKPEDFTSKSRPRTPSPDYDNVEYKLVQKQTNQRLSEPPVLGKSPNSPKKVFTNTGIDGLHCRNPDCNFYGSKDFDNFCSGCYKERNKQNLRLV